MDKKGKRSDAIFPDLIFSIDNFEEVRYQSSVNTHSPSRVGSVSSYVHVVTGTCPAKLMIGQECIYTLGTGIFKNIAGTFVGF